MLGIIAIIIGVILIVLGSVDQSKMKNHDIDNLFGDGKTVYFLPDWLWIIFIIIGVLILLLGMFLIWKTATTKTN